MTAEATVLVEQCEACCHGSRQSQQKEPLVGHDFATRSWSKVGVDLCHFDNRVLLVVVDYYSNFIEVAKMGSTGSEAVIKCLKEILNIHLLQKDLQQIKLRN